jgi:anti-anti-sigma factor
MASCSRDPRDQIARSCPYLTIITEPQRSRTVLRLRGELDVGSRDCLRLAISSVVEGRPQTLVIDLSEVDFADCGGLSVLVWAHRLLAERGLDLMITGCQPIVCRLMRLTGVDTYLYFGGRAGGGGTDHVPPPPAR